MERIRVTTSETGIHATPVAAMNETGEMPVGETEKKTGVGMTGTGGKATRVGTSVMTRGVASGRHGWIPNPRTRGNPHNRKVHTHFFPLDVSKLTNIDMYMLDLP